MTLTLVFMLGESKKTIPEPILSQQRSIHVASAGEHHTVRLSLSLSLSLSFYTLNPKP